MSDGKEARRLGAGRGSSHSRSGGSGAAAGRVGAACWQKTLTWRIFPTTSRLWVLLPEDGTAENLASVCECIWCAAFPDYGTADGTAENLASVCGLHLVRRVLCHALCDAFGAMRSGCVRLRR